MRAKNRDRSKPYVRKETESEDSGPVSFLAAGMETRIGVAADVIGTRKVAAEVIGISTAALQRYVSGENMPPFDVVARLCEASSTRLDWLAFDRGPMAKATETASESQSQPLSQDDLKIVFQLVEEAAEGKVLSPDQRAELASLVYEGLVDGLPEAKILRWARAAAK